MSGSNSSAPGSAATPPAESPLSFTVHNLAPPVLDDAARRTRLGRLKMLIVFAVCAAPVVASYLTYFVIRPSGRTNYSELIEPQRPLPDGLALTDLAGRRVAGATLAGRWMLIVVSSSACDAACERHLWIQRQLREALGRDKDRLDKVWLITDDAAPRAAALEAVTTHTTATVLHAPTLASWLQPAPGHALADHLYLVDPLGHWMMRTPVDPDPAKLKRDIEKLLRASAGWDAQAQ